MIWKKEKRPTVLVVDDDIDTLFIYEKILSKEGYTVVKAGTGNEALKKADESAPHVIIMDIMMPEADGMNAILMLKSNKKTRDIPVIVATSVEEPEDREAARNLGVAGYIVKSADMAGLLAKIKEVLGK
jgi:CheY-like chemotaxis protein